MFQRVEKTRKYLREYLAQSPYFAKNPGQFSYRYQHSLRVAAIGAGSPDHGCWTWVLLRQRWRRSAMELPSMWTMKQILRERRRCWPG